MSEKPTYDELEQRVRALEAAGDDQRRVEAALREIETSLAAIIHASPESAILMDRTGTVIRCNRVAGERLGRRWEDMIGRCIYDFLPPEVAASRRHHVEEAARSGEPIVFEDVRDGHFFSHHLHPVVDAGGTVDRVAIFSHDITEYRTLFREMLDGFALHETICDDGGHPVDYRFLAVNPAFERMTGIQAEDVVGRTVLEALPGTEPYGIETCGHVALTGEPVLFEDDFKDVGKHVEVTVFRPAPGQFACIFQDITERKRAEEALEFQRAQLKSLFDYSGEAIVLLDTNNHILNANTGFEHIFGYSPEEARGRVIEHLICPERFHLESKELDKRAEKGIKGVELIRKRKDGKEVFVQVSAGPIEVNGSVVGRFVVFDDISERKMAEDALKQRERFLRQVIDTSPNCIFIKDWDGRYILVNKSIATLYGASEEEMLGRTDLDLAGKGHLEQEEAERFLADDRDVIARHTTKRISEERLTMVDGTQRWFHTVKVPLPSDVMPRCMLGVATDITERKRAEEVREKLQSQLNQAQKMEAIGTLAGGIAHDFNNILSIIMGNTELAMLDLPEWTPARENLGEVREATLRARELVKQILLFARQKEQAITSLRLGPIVRESLKMLRASIPTTVAIQEEIDEGVPPVMADPAQIQQVVMNLCTNAGQVMEAEGGTLTFALDSADLEAPLQTVSDVLPPGRYVRMQVRDTGPGIPADIVERIFDPFFTTKGVGEGTGLGLAVVHGIVQDRKGGITVESEEGRGTTFTIYLPASDIPSVEVTAEQKRDLPRGTERVLFVDDEAMILKLGQRMLERQGYHVETRASSREALVYFTQDPDRFDLVVTDMTMPGMRGDRLATEMMAIRPDIPVILCTGYSRQISEEKALDMGIRALVMKPLTQHELADTVRRVLNET